MSSFIDFAFPLCCLPISPVLLGPGVLSFSSRQHSFLAFLAQPLFLVFILLSLTACLKNMEEKLPARLFMRVNRSCIVSLSKITAVTRTAVQINETVIPVGENYREAFSQFFRNWIV
ncbi:LytTR family transcriptional regulator DNA-binding domain-containing protein [Flavitalea flava]